MRNTEEELPTPRVCERCGFVTIDDSADALAAARAEVGRLKGAMNKAIREWDRGEDPNWVLVGVKSAIVGCEAAKGAGG